MEIQSGRLAGSDLKATYPTGERNPKPKTRIWHPSSGIVYRQAVYPACARPAPGRRTPAA
ncbi:hypothetical protein CBM2589_B250074 [Cupriavidus taiwanensis]|uniref:Uncharacterized protein n=1 Tax=Cupriavidus taiwanensis TaxID=164546 RepID=A0A375BT20_9BURK|nr:hypothetical protein CBM2589_B250074 [Cupriavidus taiwanensis]